jgi:hypothetical protein
MESPYCLQPLLLQSCSEILKPPHCLQPFLWWLWSQMWIHHFAFNHFFDSCVHRNPRLQIPNTVRTEESVLGVSLNAQSQVPDIPAGNADGKSTRFRRVSDPTESLRFNDLTLVGGFCQVMSRDLIFFLLSVTSSSWYLTWMIDSEYWVKGVCGNNVFTLFTTDCVFQQRLIQYLVVQLFVFTTQTKLTQHMLRRFEQSSTRVTQYDCLWYSAEGDDENNLGQILEVLTATQGYLMFLNNRVSTVSSLVSSRTETPLLLNQFLSSNVLPLFLVLLTYFERYLIEVTVI